MAIYLGGTKCKFVVDGEVCGFNIPTPIVITNGIRLLPFAMSES